ncbi:MAG: translation initiation factor IF-2 [Gracilimonas sp.]|uniref:translation initiation factor IF-2 n=1 Tax=Gracilimonas sp. TaxID=1974203 RepID=UPI0019A965BD|nr:translation initiation factor IF-2 [Gracilimonas sp.]MBD3615650.1 translation initiation factor IF-2 [Gracilimonas sp.]
MTSKRPKPLFKVAAEFNVATQSIVDTLNDNGFDAANRPNFKITPEMYTALDEVYGEDKAKSEDHEKAREEYESRRSQMMNQRNDSVTIENVLEPIEDSIGLEPEDETPDLEPEEEETQQELEPEEEETKAKEEKKETEDKEPEPEKEAEKAEPAAKEEKKAAEKEEPEIEAETEPEEDTEEKEEAPKEEKKVAKKEKEEETQDKKADKEEEKEKEKTEKKEEAKTEEPEVEEEDDEEEEEVIRGAAGKLKGTKVLGKASFTSDIADKKKRKTRKRRKDRKGDDSSAKKESKKDDSSSDAKKTSKKKKRKRKTEIDETDVDKMMRETMKKMQSSKTVGSKRSKRRRERKEEREEELQKQAEMEELESDIVETTEFITANELADLLDVGVNDIISVCMSIGLMITINQRLDAGTIELVAEEYGKEVKFIEAEEMDEELTIPEDEEEDLEARAPIITVMGHVDHGKTSLLDYIREEKVAAGEAGGITQHVGAYEVVHNENKITFLDTPGHEAFTAMRSRGAQATDIVILVVAADDSVMPQTIEAINHAKAAGVPLVVAINKMDKEGVNPDKIKQQLSEHDVIVEEYGGQVQYSEVSAHTGQGIEDLLEKVLIEAELLELKANPNRRADGVVLEARLDKGKGIVANILVQGGTLKVGDAFVAGPCFGRVRAMENELGKRVKEAGPSTPVQLTGFDDMPQAGDKLIVAEDEKTAKEVASERMQIRREQAMRSTKHMTLDDISRRLALGEVSELNIIIKADVDGSIEALSGSLQKLGTDEVSVNIIHTGAGAISESDVLLASASDAIIIGFQVRPTSQARKLAEEEEIDIRLFSVIYDAVDEVRDALEGLLSPELKEQMMGVVEVREIFKVSKVGTIAGCYVTEGKVERNNPIRLVRDGVVIYDGEIDALKRFKDDVKEVSSGYECGISIKGYNDIKVGDQIESYKITEQKRTLEDSAG